MKAVLDLPESHAEVLLFLIETIPPAEYLWALTGSAGLRLQGVDLPVHDLDLQVEAETVFRLEQMLADFMKVAIHRWETEHTLSYHGQAEIQGLQVELLGDIRHRQSDGSWGSPLEIPSVRVWIEWRGQRVPALSLEHEAAAYETMGRAEKAARIRAALKKERR